MEAPEQTKNRTAIGSSDTTPRNILKGTCTPMFTAALFTLAKLWKQPRCPRIENIVFMYNGILFSHKK
jgi:hypothetical protein